MFPFLLHAPGRPGVGSRHKGIQKRSVHMLQLLLQHWFTKAALPSPVATTEAENSSDCATAATASALPAANADAVDAAATFDSNSTSGLASAVVVESERRWSLYFALLDTVDDSPLHLVRLSMGDGRFTPLCALPLCALPLCALPFVSCLLGAHEPICVGCAQVQSVWPQLRQLLVSPLPAGMPVDSAVDEVRLEVKKGGNQPVQVACCCLLCSPLGGGGGSSGDGGDGGALDEATVVAYAWQEQASLPWATGVAWRQLCCHLLQAFVVLFIQSLCTSIWLEHVDLLSGGGV